MNSLYDILDKALEKSGPFILQHQQVNIEGQEAFDIIVYDTREGARPIGIYAATVYPDEKFVKFYHNAQDRFARGLFNPLITIIEEEGYIIKE